MDRQVVSLVLGRLGLALVTHSDRQLRGLRRHRDAAGRRRADPARPGRDRGGRRRPAHGDASRRPGDPALPALARRAAPGRSRHLLRQQHAHRRAHRRPARQHAQARVGHRHGGGARGAVPRHHHRDVPRPALRPGGEHARRRHHLGAGVHDRDPRRAGLRGLAALAARALLRERRHRPSRRAPRLRHAGHHAGRRHLGADDPHDPRRGHRDAEDALCRDGAAQGRLAPAHRAAPRPAERGRPDRQRRRALALLPGRRRHHRRDDLQLSRHRQAHGRRGLHPRPAADPDLRDDLLPRATSP